MTDNVTPGLKNPEQISIPIVVGVTGHRFLHPDQIPIIKEKVRQQLQKLIVNYAHSPVVMINSLAEGADQLCAEVALELGIPLIAPLPLAQKDYETDFSNEARTVFYDQCSKAAELFVVSPFEEYEEITRDFCYRQAGIYLAKHCHVLLALWNGSEPKPGGCGTAEVVDMKLNATYTEKDSNNFKTNDGAAVMHFLSIRNTDDVTQKEITVSLLENVPGALDAVLTKTENFNQLSKTGQFNNQYPLIAQNILEESGQNNQRLHTLYQHSDQLSVSFRDKYIASIKWLSFFGVSLVVVFLLYDELESNIFLYLYWLVLLISGIVLSNIKKNQWHEKYLESRALAESLRVQFYLRVSGINHCVSDDFTWSQKKEVVWVERAMDALTAFPNITLSFPEENIKTEWITDQYNYHRTKADSTGKQHIINDRISSAMLYTSLLTFAVIFILEISSPDILAMPVFPEWVNRILLVHAGQQFIIRGIFKIALGLFAAVTLFLSNYYGKLSLDHKCSDHKKLAGLYQTALTKWDIQHLDKKKLLLDLAREEITENGVWLAYNRDNRPTLDF